jgi:glycerophosphoryl diester phosphodiesterase
MSTLRRVGHKGADLIAPGNTPESFDAALEAGVDMIEFDVLPADPRSPKTAPLLLLHDYTHGVESAPTLDEGLDHLCSEGFAGVDLDVDLKIPGYEERVVAALRERDLLGRTLVSSMYRSSLRRVREIEPRIRLGWSIPLARRNYVEAPAHVRIPAYTRITLQRPSYPRRIRAALRRGEIDAVMSHWRLVTPRLVRAVMDNGGELYVWTVDEAPRIQMLEALGVTGVITNDPRLFAQTSTLTNVPT